MVSDGLIKDFYKKEIESFNPYFNHVEQIKKFELLPHEWTIETGEMTPKLSLRRKVVMEKNNELIRKMYS
jgi:long-chain acyl-CoA synthetase